MSSEVKLFFIIKAFSISLEIIIYIKFNYYDIKHKNYFKKDRV